MKQIIIYSFIIYLNLLNSVFSSEIKILYKINNSVITTYDVNEEINYLVSLNKNLSQLNKDQLLSNARQSLIREKIKKNEIDKFYNVDYSASINSDNMKRIIKDFRQRIGFNSDEEFENYLLIKNINFDDLKKKFVIEHLWNSLVFDRYKNMVKVDSNLIDKKLEKLLETKSDILSFNLSEIIFLEKDKSSTEKKYQEIISSIKTVGFKDAAVIHSIAESSKLGGDLGWINENQISKKILGAIENLKVGDFSNPIITAGGIIILKINDKKKIKSQINKDIEMKKLISFEKERILNEYSIIYYKEVENKAYVEKF